MVETCRGGWPSRIRKRRSLACSMPLNFPISPPTSVPWSSSLIKTPHAFTEQNCRFATACQALSRANKLEPEASFLGPSPEMRFTRSACAGESTGLNFMDPGNACSGWCASGPSSSSKAKNLTCRQLKGADAARTKTSTSCAGRSSSSVSPIAYFITNNLLRLPSQGLPKWERHWDC
jgi:hypothetical protein